MAAGFVSSIIKWTAEKFSSLIPAQTAGCSTFEPCTRASEDFEMLQKTMLSIQEVLENTEEKDMQSFSEKLRLKELSGAARDAEDVLEEYEYEVLRAKVIARRQAGSGRKRKFEEVCETSTDDIPALVPVPNDLIIRMKEIKKRFDTITKEWDTLRLRESDGPRRRDDHAWTPKPTSSLLHEPNVRGREKDKEHIIQMLLEDDENRKNSVSVLPIVGMGGIGKTTLAQLVYNDPRVSRHFRQKGWVCVSENFDVLELTRKIYTSITKGSCDYTEINEIVDALREELMGKRFLLVLDDVWIDNPNLWNPLRDLLFALEPGKVIVTTRNESTATIMQTMPLYRLGCLGFDDCWLIFLQQAFEGRDPRHFRIQDLKNLSHLKEVQILNLKDIDSVEDAQEANLRSKRDLKALQLSWEHCYALYCNTSRGQSSEEPSKIPSEATRSLLPVDWFEERVLASLEPQTNLAELLIYCYGGIRFPQWVGDVSFSKLVKITLLNCQKCILLPSLGQLPSLTYLDMSYIESLLHIGREFYGCSSEAKGFPSLEILAISSMDNWVEWGGGEYGDFPRLQEISIAGCPKLQRLPQHLYSSLTRLFLSNCEQLDELPLLPSLTHLTLRGTYDEKILSSLHLHLLRFLEITGLETLPIEFRKMYSLQKLRISFCYGLETVVSLFELPSLEELSIRNSPQVQFRLHSSEDVITGNCPVLQEWCRRRDIDLTYSGVNLARKNLPMVKQMHNRTLLNIERLNNALQYVLSSHYLAEMAGRSYSVIH
ncbi:Disease resistance protein RGA2 [Ananas comosus]|uniref:Disease resistance protein RGA2 n=1 Tax=Ananas comosus TaxID=4615 RepID=A0A199VJ44_ANACO|nr:Disease resistance protein RGA2 [Ananas comosus]